MNDTGIPKVIYEWELEGKKKEEKKTTTDVLETVHTSVYSLEVILALQHRMLNIEIYGELSLMDREIDYIFRWRKISVVRKHSIKKKKLVGCL